MPPTVTAKETRFGRNLLRGTIPVPDTWVPGPLHLRDSLGTSLPTEQYVAKRGPAGNARVLELRASASSPSGQQVYSVHAGAVASPDSFHNDIDVEIRCEAPRAPSDPLFTSYSSDLLVAGASTAPAGAVTQTRRKYGELVSSEGTRLMGYSAHVTTVAGEPGVFLVTMTVQNGNVGDPTAPLGANILHHLFFHELFLVLPVGWSITHLMPTPHTSSTHLVTATGDGKLHVVLQGGRLPPFRFAIHTAASAGRASILLSDSGWFVCNFSKTEWSWNNPLTAWYGPQGEMVPELNLAAHKPYDDVYADVKADLLAGTAAFIGGQATTPCGPYHIRGITSSNQTGGVNIWGYPAYDVINQRDVSRLHMLKAVLGMDISRDANTKIGDLNPPETGVCIVGNDQLPIDPGEWDLSNINLPTPGHFNINHSGPFPRKNADTWRYDQASGAGQLPWYWGSINQFNVYAYSHMVRSLAQAYALVDLYNDPAAREHIGNWSVWARFLTLEYGYGELSQFFQQSLVWPGKGAGSMGGRFGGWPMVCCEYDWQTTPDDERRANYAGWLSTLQGFYANAQLASGAWHALTGGTPVDQLNGQYNANGHSGSPNAAASQAIEIGINSQALRGLHVCTGSAAVLSMFRALCNGLWNYHWIIGSSGPYFVSPVRSNQDISLDAWTLPYQGGPPAGTPGGAAPDCFYSGPDNYQIAPIVLGALRYSKSLGLSYSASLPAALSVIQAFTGVSDLGAQIASLTATVSNPDYGLNKLGEGWGAVLAMLVDYATVTSPTSDIAGRGHALSVGRAQAAANAYAYPLGLGLSLGRCTVVEAASGVVDGAGVGLGLSVGTATIVSYGRAPGLLAGVGTGLSVGVCSLGSGPEPQRSGPGGGVRRRPRGGSLARY